MNTSLPEQTKQLVLGGMLYFKSCREKYLMLMKGGVAGTLLDPDTTSAYAIVERSIRLFISADISVKSRVIMRRLVDDLNKLPPTNSALISSYMDVIEQLSDTDQFTEQLCANVLSELTTNFVLKDAVANLKKMRSVAQIQQTLQTAANKLGGIARPGKITLFNPVQSAKDLLIHRDKVPTGISFLDQLLGGGIVWGEHGGCLGPPSGGKSTLANMLLCNVAIQGHNAMLLQFEQSVKYNSDIMSRIYSYLTRLPRSEFADKDYDELSESAKQALASCSKVSDRIRVGSFTDDNVNRTVDAVIETIDEAIESGFEPKLVIIDWLGAVVSEFLGAATGTDKSYPILAQEIQDKLGAYGKTKNISFFFLHQTSTDAAAKNPAYKPTMYDSYYFRGFSQKLEFCLELGTKSHQPDGRFACWLHCGKVRGAEPDKSTIVLLDGANSKMEATKEGQFMTNSKGQFVEVTRAITGEQQPVVDTTPTEVEATFFNGFGV